MRAQDLVLAGDWNETFVDACEPMVGPNLLRYDSVTVGADGEEAWLLLRDHRDRRRHDVRRRILLEFLLDRELRLANTGPPRNGP